MENLNLILSIIIVAAVIAVVLLFCLFYWLVKKLYWAVIGEDFLEMEARNRELEQCFGELLAWISPLNTPRQEEIMSGLTPHLRAFIKRSQGVDSKRNCGTK